MTGDFDMIPQLPFHPVQPCPSCGHCPTCGRGPSYPIYYGPMWQYIPNQVVYCSGTTTQGGETATVRFGNIS